MTSRDIRRQFLDFFASKGHKIIPSAPIVAKSDPTLLFINSGMAPLKDFFLGNQTPPAPRVADTQKCLRVSGKHNDLEDVGFDGYHHTMFEMLGNWSFGDYFKKDALAWSWELLTEVYKLPKDRLYVSVFKGDEKEKLPFDQEAFDTWKQFLPEDRILPFGKKENFWEMGDQGPCGPCSEIHVDLRPDAERAAKDGRELVNADDPNVIEIWNNVFMQFNRRADGSLEELPAKSVDTGMGFERLCRAVQGSASNYDTDVFAPLIRFLAAETGIAYEGTYPGVATPPTASSRRRGAEEWLKTDVAMRVVADHLRAVSFTIADGELPSNTGAGYVIRRILRRAVRYAYSFLNIKEPILNRMVPILAEEFHDVFPELKAQLDFVSRVILEEEKSFLKTLERGIVRLQSYIIDSIIEDFSNKVDKIQNSEIQYARGLPLSKYGIDIFFHQVGNIGKGIKIKLIDVDNSDELLIENIDTGPFSYETLIINQRDIFDGLLNKKINEFIFLRSGIKFNFSPEDFSQINPVPGKVAFELFDTFGFPIDLTRLILREYNLTVDEASFERLLNEQKDRSRKDAVKEVGDWQVLSGENAVEFIGYDVLDARESHVVKYRTVVLKGQPQYQLVLDLTPFYPEGGGQVGDTGTMIFGTETIRVLDTKKENDLVIHILEKLPADLSAPVQCQVDPHKRRLTENNHSVTHLLHAALRQVLGTHVQQKGSYLDDRALRFDFAHFQKLTDEEVARIERIVNEKIRQNIPLEEARQLPLEEAKKAGAMMLFGEKYGETVRMITFDPAFSRELCGGCHVRATGQIGFFKITAETAISAGVRRIEALTAEAAEQYVAGLEQEIAAIKNTLKAKDLAKAVSDLQDDNKRLQKEIERLVQEQANSLREGLRSRAGTVNGIKIVAAVLPIHDANAVKNLAVELERELAPAVVALGSVNAGKPSLTIKISDALIKEKGLNAGTMVRELAQKFLQGGGGGQPGFATAGGNDAGRLDAAVEGVRGYL